MPLTLNGTTGIAGVDGSAGTPAARGSDTNTGIVYGVDTLQIATNGLTAVTVNSSQNVGIGTTNPVLKFAVSNNGAQGFEIDPTAIASAPAFVTYDRSAGSFIQSSFRASNYAWLNASGTQVLTLDSSGNLLVSTTSTTGRGVAFLTQSGDWVQTVSRTANNTNDLYLMYSNDTTLGGKITVTSNTCAFTSVSDYRLKDNIEPMSGALDKVSQLKPVTFQWKSDGTNGQGFIAHELQAVVPECVAGEKDAVDADGNPSYQGVDTSFLVATLTAAIQELSNKLDAAEARIATLEAN